MRSVCVSNAVSVVRSCDLGSTILSCHQEKGLKFVQRYGHRVLFFFVKFQVQLDNLDLNLT